MNVDMPHQKELDNLTRLLFEEDALGEILRQLPLQHNFALVEDRVQNVESDYRLMLDYLLRNYQDNQRQQVFERLKRKAFAIIQDLRLDNWLSMPLMKNYKFTLQTHTLDIDDMRQNLESFVQDSTLLSLEAPETRQEKAMTIYERHQHQLQLYFELLAFSPQWSSIMGQRASEMILSPTIENNDALVLTSAIMLGSTNVADPEKVRTLLRIYESAHDNKLRQRALVGWIFALTILPLEFFPDIAQEISDVLTDPQAQVDVREMITQVVLCLNTEKDSEKLQQDIMPDLMKNSQFEVTKFGIKEKEEDSLEEILHPEAADEAAQKMEDGIKKIIDMRDKGTDIYFGGFSHMKRFAFFYTLCNWFMPFYLEHPQLQKLGEEILHSGLLDKLISEGPFCDSDKYSFVLGLGHVFNSLPDSIKNMIKNGENVEMIPLSMDSDSELYARRMYLQDLYRFYRLSPECSAFNNPFNVDQLVKVICNHCFVDNLNGEGRKLRKFFFKKQLYKQLRTLQRYYTDLDNLDDLLMRGSFELVDGNPINAAMYYVKAYKMAPDNEKVLKGYARASFASGSYERAAKLYGNLLKMTPGKLSYALNRAIALINDSKVEEGVKELYKLNYEHPDETNVMRALAWGELSLKNIENARKMYQKLLESASANHTDWLNAGFCAWMEGKREEAVSLMVRYMNEKKSHDRELLLEAIDDAKDLFDTFGIDDLEKKLMVDIVCGRLAN
jgi:hypothetical protein